MNPPLWKARVRAALDDADRVATLFELIPAPSPQSVIVLTHPQEPDAVVEAYYAEPPDEAALKAVIGEAVAVEALPDQDWIRMSQEGLPPVRAGRFFIYGAHDAGKAPVNAIALRIDAGEAFGTGHHETTTGCLIALDKLKRAGLTPDRVLDLGCGTGVLALGAQRLWRGARVLASDLDPRAVRITVENARANGGQGSIRAATAEGLLHPSIMAARPFDLLIANILAGPLTFLARDIVAATRPGGRIVLSGLLGYQERLVLAFYRSLGCRLERAERLGPWSALTLRR